MTELEDEILEDSLESTNDEDDTCSTTSSACGEINDERSVEDLDAVLNGDTWIGLSDFLARVADPQLEKQVLSTEGASRQTRSNLDQPGKGLPELKFTMQDIDNDDLVSAHIKELLAAEEIGATP